MRGDVFGHLVHAVPQPVELDEQHRGRVPGEAAGHAVLDGVDGAVVHHLQRRRHQSRRHDSRDHVPAVLERIAHREHRLDCLRLAEDTQNGGGRYPQGPLASHEDSGQIEAERIDILATQPDDLAAGEHYLEPEHVIGGDAVLEAVGAAGVLGDVAAQGARLLAGRIGGVVVAEGGEDRGDVQIEDAHLDGHPLVRQIDLQHLAHPAHLDDHGAVEGEGPATQVRPAPAGHEGDALPREDLEHGRDLLGGAHEDDGPGHGPLQVRVVFVGLEVRQTIEHVVRPDDRSELIGQWSSQREKLPA